MIAGYPIRLSVDDDTSAPKISSPPRLMSAGLSKQGGSGAETGRNFEAAYQYCKDPRDRAQVHAAQADFYFRNG